MPKKKRIRSNNYFRNAPKLQSVCGRDGQWKESASLQSTQAREKSSASLQSTQSGQKKLKMISSQAPPMRVRAESKGAMVGVAILRNPYVPYLEDFWGAAQGGKRKFPSHIRGTAVSIPKPSEHNS